MYNAAFKYKVLYRPDEELVQNLHWHITDIKKIKFYLRS
ncbi:hypothetical protein MIDIC_390004 [Alphaproteobacteria bacterium]